MDGRVAGPPPANLRVRTSDAAGMATSVTSQAVNVAVASLVAVGERGIDHRRGMAAHHFSGACALDLEKRIRSAIADVFIDVGCRRKKFASEAPRRSDDIITFIGDVGDRIEGV